MPTVTEPSEPLKPVEKEEDFTEAMFEDTSTVLPGGGQISEEMISFYKSLGSTSCTSQAIQTVEKLQKEKFNAIMKACVRFIGGSDDPEYRRAANKKQTIIKKCRELITKLQNGKTSPEMIKELATLRGNKEPVQRFSQFMVAVKKAGK